MYFLFIILYLTLLSEDSESGRKKFQHLKFVKHQSSDALRHNYGFNEREAKNYQRLIYVLVNICKANETSYVAGISLVILRTLVVSFIALDLKYVLLVSMPNAFSLLFTAFIQINTISCFYLLFWFNCLFTKKYLKISAEELDASQNGKPLKSRLLGKLAKRSVYRFNFILRLFHFVQEISNYSVAFYFIGLTCLDILVPYIILLAENDRLSLFMVISLTTQTLLTAIYTIAHTNAYVIESVS